MMKTLAAALLTASLVFACAPRYPETPPRALSAEEEALVETYRSSVAVPPEVPDSQELQRCMLGFASGELFSFGTDPQSRWVKDLSICLDLQDELISNRRAMAERLGESAF